MRIAIVGGLAALVLAARAPAVRADIGPPDPARKICMGKPAGEACTIDGEAGTCQGPHPSRMYCIPPKEGSGAGSTGAASATNHPAAGSGGASEPVPTGAPAQGSDASTPAAEPSAEPAPSPGHKRGCAIAEPGSAGVLAIAALAMLRRRRSRSR